MPPTHAGRRFERDGVETLRKGKAVGGRRDRTMQLGRGTVATLIAVALTGTIASGATYAATEAKSYGQVCLNSHHTVRLLQHGKCPANYVKAIIGARGTTGPAGPKGDTGPQGPKGDPGADALKTRVLNYADAGPETAPAAPTETTAALIGTQSFTLQSHSMITVLADVDLTHSSDTACPGTDLDQLQNFLVATVDDPFPPFSSDPAPEFALTIPNLLFASSAPFNAGAHTLRVYHVTEGCRAGGGTGTATASNVRISVDAEPF